MTANEYIERTLDTWRTHKGDTNGYKMITSSDQQIAELMIAFAQEKVKEAMEAISTAIQDSVKAHCDDHTPFYGPCCSCGKYENTLELPEEDEVLEIISNSYSIENIK